ncbi:MAG: cytochrome c [Candidatus Rokubacteria bacterium]|nr:cytochrome c [Candidatus Rokubacteria bacterium]
MRVPHLLALLVCAVLAGACGEQREAGPAPAGEGNAELGRQIYLAQCTACHASDPAQRGPVGPPVKGASRALLEARILHGTYPPGYTPKQNTSVMQPMPNLAANILDLAAYLR